MAPLLLWGLYLSTLLSYSFPTSISTNPFLFLIFFYLFRFLFFHSVFFYTSFYLFLFHYFAIFTFLNFSLSLSLSIFAPQLLQYLSWRNKLNGAAQGGEFDLLRWWGSVVYITSSRRTVRLGSLQGLYERFPIKK